MVFTRSKLNKLSKEGLIEELLNIDNLSEKINGLAKKMDDFATKFDRFFFFELQIFSKPAIHYYANKLLIWSNYPRMIFSI